MKFLIAALAVGCFGIFGIDAVTLSVDSIKQAVLNCTLASLNSIPSDKICAIIQSTTGCVSATVCNLSTCLATATVSNLQSLLNAVQDLASVRNCIKSALDALVCGNVCDQPGLCITVNGVLTIKLDTLASATINTNCSFYYY
ncbi:hypothetical protein FQR65_LT00932 [Abscondita terminalis]|nr:hypothetical protein FQR65_LT00932 [Abscondita terminalis]